MFKNFTVDNAQEADKVSILKEQRDKAVEILMQLSLGDRNNAVESVKRQVGSPCR